jgi:hypothetical protein
MLTIRKEQLDAFRRFYNEQFAPDIIKRLKSTIPGHLSGIDDDSLFQEVLRLIDECQKFDINKKANIYKLCYIRFVFPSVMSQPYSRETLNELTFPDREEDDKTTSLFMKVISNNYKK